MRKNDLYNIDGHTLITFLAVLEEGAVTKAAGKMGVTQSAVSHTLDKLRVCVVIFSPKVGDIA